jgi:hypothetical protein
MQCVASPTSSCGASGAFNFSAVFNYAGQPQCASTTVGSCTLSMCAPMMDFGSADDAGTLSLSGGSIPTGTTVADSNGLGDYLLGTFGTWFRAGQPLAVSGSGGMVPAFEPAPVTPPPFVGLISPQIPDAGMLTVSSSADLFVAWSGGQSGATMTFSLADVASFTSLECDWSASLGQGTIAQSLLAKLTGGSSGTGSLSYGQQTTASFTVGQYAVSESATLFSQNAVTFE